MYLCQRIQVTEARVNVRLKYRKGKFSSRLELDEPPASGEALDERRCRRVKERRHKRPNAGISELEA